MVNLGWIFMGILVIGFAIWAHLYFWRAYYERKGITGEYFFFKNRHGWTLTLERISNRSPDDVLESKGVILCCAGLACSGRIFHLNSRLSFANHLDHAGYEVWILHPRGMGPSQHPKTKQDWDFGFEGYQEDAHDGFKELYTRYQLPITWIGHSMGGLLGYTLAFQKEPGLQRLITLGTPATFEHSEIPPFHLSLFKWFGYGLPFAPYRFLATLVAPWSGWTSLFHPKPLWVNYTAFHQRDVRQLMGQVFHAVPRKLIKQFLKAIEFKTSLYGYSSKELADAYAKLDLPILAIAGDRDGLAPLSQTQSIQTFNPSALTFHCQPNYGHGELVVGEGCQKEIIPLILTWLDQTNLPLSKKTGE